MSPIAIAGTYCFCPVCLLVCLLDNFNIGHNFWNGLRKRLYKCVQRERRSSLPELMSGSACRRTTIDYRCDQWCVWPIIGWSNKRLGGSVLILKNNKRSLIWQRLLTVAVPIIVTKQLISPSIPNARSWITKHNMSAYKSCDCRHFEFCLHLKFYFYPFSIYLQAKHDSFCAIGTFCCRFLDNT